MTIGERSIHASHGGESLGRKSFTARCVAATSAKMQGNFKHVRQAPRQKSRRDDGGISHLDGDAGGEFSRSAY